MNQGSSQGILACRAGTRAPPAGTHEIKKSGVIKLKTYFPDSEAPCFYLFVIHLKGLNPTV
jgi:hypothetical protein